MKQIARFLNLFGPFVGLIVVYLIFFFQAPASFHSLLSTKIILQQTVIIGTAALGATLIIIAAGIDLSVGSLIALGGVVTALTLKKLAGGSGGELGIALPVLAAVAGIVACGALGFANGFMTAVFGIVPFIVTLGMMQIARGITLGLAHSNSVQAPKSLLNKLMIIEPQIGVWYSVAPGVWIMLLLTALLWVVLRFTVFGRRIFAVGSNEATARLCGINVTLTRIWVYTIGGIMAGISGFLGYATLGLGDPVGAQGYELDVIAAVVIGGGSFNGGEGSVIGSIIGAVIIQVLRNGCVQIGVEKYVQNIVIGSIIIIAVAVDQLKHKREA